MWLSRVLFNKKVIIQSLGLQSYSAVMSTMKRIVEAKMPGKDKQPPEIVDDYLFLCQHHPVYTVGIRTKDYMDTEVINRLKELDAEYQYTDRGGLITFHGPGQLVCYPVLNLKNYGWTLRCYIHKLEQVVMDTCQQFGVETHRTDDVGIWIGNEKIAAIGVHCQRHITSHGLALNCNTDLSWFGHIVPCGLQGKSMTSLSRQLDDIVTVEHVTPHLLDKFQRVFGCEMVEK
ncbi:octanoyl-[acyl-carrier-protein]:protein N-octanoyltransferase LIPT2, mitochondrial-like [Clytia hemisphaerica]|uniref:octanoyl-[acyl-carrier-protein]:protein N-octanoyltransferase LIPT2, mitochondrial-like n=1 Tax=Clytia hemisphaerica TaxID=252671 RepID=UPI0034D6E7DA